MVLCDRFVTAITEARLFLGYLPGELCEKSHDCKGTDVCSHCYWSGPSIHSRVVVAGPFDRGWDQFALIGVLQAPLAGPTEPTKVKCRLRHNREWSQQFIAMSRSRSSLKHSPPFKDIYRKLVCGQHQKWKVATRFLRSS
jgi:hypothetical protein